MKPQKEWGWEIAVYLFLAGVGSGSFMAGIVTNWFFNPSRIIHVGSLSIDIGKLGLFWGPILVAIGAPFLILDLGVRRRFLYACLNPKTSWVARGFLILFLFMVLGFSLLILSTFSFSWLDKRTMFWRFGEVLGLLSALATAVYTGILLKATRSVPFWNTPLLEALFLSSSLTTGLMGIILLTIGYGLLVPSQNPFTLFFQNLVDIEKVLVLIEGLILALYLFVNSRAQGQSDVSIRLLLSGEKRFLFWGGIVLMGFAFPLSLMALYTYFPSHHLLLVFSGCFLFIGRLLLRFGILKAGIKDPHPMKRFIAIQYDLRPPHPTLSLRKGRLGGMSPVF